MEPREAHYPGRPPIDAYGNGGFRFAGMSHLGSLLFLPSGVYAWPVAASKDITVTALNRVMAEARLIEILVLGCGDEIDNPSPAVKSALETRGVALEFMRTGPAARTYNVLLAEDRAVAAALIAVENS